jgi:hypothetical protein
VEGEVRIVHTPTRLEKEVEERDWKHKDHNPHSSPAVVLVVELERDDP